MTPCRPAAGGRLRQAAPRFPTERPTAGALHRGAVHFAPPLAAPQVCREQIVQWILQNTSDSQAGGGTGQYVDPYTGSSAYVPSAPSGGGGAGGSSSGGYGVTGGGADPFTGGGAARPLHLPAKSYLIYDQVTAKRACSLGGPSELPAGRYGMLCRPAAVGAAWGLIDGRCQRVGG